VLDKERKRKKEKELGGKGGKSVRYKAQRGCKKFCSLLATLEGSGCFIKGIVSQDEAV
jgi:hypothetical protein